MSEIVRLTTRPKINGEMAESVLSEWLERAKDGQFVQIGIVGVHADGSVSHENSDGEHIHQLISALEILKWRLIEEREIV